MPVDTARSQDHDLTRRPAGPHTAAHDDDRGAAQRASLAGLRQEAAKLPGTSDHDHLHTKADDADRDGLQASLLLVAKQIHAASRQIDQQLARPASGGAGIQPQLDAIRAIVDEVTLGMFHLDAQFGTHKQMTDGSSGGLTRHYQLLYPELGAVETAYSGFRGAVARANAFGASMHVTFDLAPMSERYKTLQDKLGIEALRISCPFVDERSDAKAFDDALGGNVEAIVAEVRAVRAGLAAGKVADATFDYNNLKRHTGAVASLLAQLHEPGALGRVKPRVRHAMHELDALEREVRHDPAAAAHLAAGELPRYRREIAARIGG